VLVYEGIRGNSDFTMIQLIMTSFLVLSAFYGTPAIAAGVSTTSTSTDYMISINTTDPIMTDSQKAVQQKAIAYFKDEPILVAIAGCESSYRQVDENGYIVRGKVNKGDIGVMQINEYYHADKAKELGDNLKTLNGNMAYAKYLYEREGTKPWASSEACWSQALGPVSNQVALK
jgi:hypothetical protein